MHITACVLEIHTAGRKAFQTAFEKAVKKNKRNLFHRATPIMLYATASLVPLLQGVNIFLVYILSTLENVLYPDREKTAHT